MGSAVMVPAVLVAMGSVVPVLEMTVALEMVGVEALKVEVA